MSCDLVAVLAGYIPKAQPRRLAAGRWDRPSRNADFRQISVVQTTLFLSASGTRTDPWLSVRVLYTGLRRGIHVPYTRVAAGAPVSAPRDSNRAARGRESPRMPGLEPWPPPSQSRLFSPHICAGFASPSSARTPQRASRKTHNGIFEQLPKDGFQIFSYFSLVMEALSG